VLRLWAILDRERIGNGERTLGKEHLPVSELECRLGKLCTPTVSFLLEGWIFRPSLQEIRERFLKMSQSLLQWYTANLRQKLQVILLFPFSQQCRSIAVTDSFFLVVPSLCSHSKGAIVDQTSTAHSASEQGFLLRRGIEAVLKGSLCHVSHYSNYSVRYVGSNVKPCF